MKILPCTVGDFIPCRKHSHFHFFIIGMRIFLKSHLASAVIVLSCGCPKQNTIEYFILHVCCSISPEEVLITHSIRNQCFNTISTNVIFSTCQTTQYICSTFSCWLEGTSKNISLFISLCSTATSRYQQYSHHYYHAPSFLALGHYHQPNDNTFTDFKSSSAFDNDMQLTVIPPTIRCQLRSCAQSKDTTIMSRVQICKKVRKSFLFLYSILSYLSWAL